ncbi:MAG: sugar transferase [Flexilinea sp.]
MSYKRLPSFRFGKKQKLSIKNKKHLFNKRNEPGYGIYQGYLKRKFDITLSIASLIIFFPLLILIGFLILCDITSPIIFKQKRIGLNGKIFTIYKFNKMGNITDSTGKLLPEEQRITKLGMFLRSSSLDELPQLWNILKGEMSVVGPRPLLVKDLSFMNPEQRKRHLVLPGLTGLAQINGRNRLRWEEKFEYDLEYIKQISFIGDIKICLKTFSQVVRHTEINYYTNRMDENYGDYLLRNGKIDESVFRKKLTENE